tara:strand:- start:95 stop:364 length:270 start_codon:yes stop_codon:yes gene_type:complete
MCIVIILGFFIRDNNYLGLMFIPSFLILTINNTKEFGLISIVTVPIGIYAIFQGKDYTMPEPVIYFLMVCLFFFGYLVIHKNHFKYKEK